MGLLSEDFKDGYHDGHSQAIENVRWNIIAFLERNNGQITIDIVNDICNYCARVDEDYLNQ